MKLTSTTTLIFAGLLLIAAPARAQWTPQLFKPAEPSVAPAREVRLAPITLKTQTDRIVQLNLSFGNQMAMAPAPFPPLPAGDIRGQAFITVRLRVETTLRP